MSWHNFKRKVTYYIAVSPMGMAFISGWSFACALALLANQSPLGLLEGAIGVICWVVADKTDTDFIALVREFVRAKEKGEE